MPGWAQLRPIAAAARGRAPALPLAAAVLLGVPHGLCAAGRQARAAPGIRASIGIPTSTPFMLLDPDRPVAYYPARIDDSRHDTRGVAAFDWRRRRTLWRARGVNGRVPLLVAGGTVLCGRDDPPFAEGYTGLDMRTGQVRWQSRPLRGYYAAPTVAHGRIYEANDRGFRCTEAATGRVIWETVWGGNIDYWPFAPPVVGGRTFTHVVWKGQMAIAAFGAPNGRVIWRRPYPWGDLEWGTEGAHVEHNVGPMAAAGGHLVGILPSGPQRPMHDYDAMGPPPAALHCWDASTGRLVWRRKEEWLSDLSPRSLVTVAGGLVHVFDHDAIRTYSLRNGRQVWQSSKAPGGQMVVLGRYLWTVEGFRQVWVVGRDALTGKEKFRVSLPGAESLVALLPWDGASKLLAVIDRPGRRTNILYVVALPHPGRG